MPRVWPLVGRSEELALLEQARDDGAVTGCVVAGEAGVGKTRLVSEAMASAASAGWATEWTTASQELASVPLGAFAHLVSVEPDRSDSQALDAGGFAGALAALRERAAGRRLWLAVDDAHLLDPASVGLLQLVARQGIGFVAVTVRSGEPGPRRLAWLWKDGGERIELQVLSRRETEQLVGDALAGPVEAAALAELWALTRGNPLFLRELVLGATAAGTLRVSGAGVWHRTGPLARAGARLGEVVEGRLNASSEVAAGLLEVLAVGEPLERRLAEALSSPEELARAEADGLATPEGREAQERIRLAHPLYGEVVRARLSPTRARTIRRRVADALHAAGEVPDSHLVRVARWRLEAGDTGSPGLFVAAARRMLFGYSLAAAAAIAGDDDRHPAHGETVEEPFELAARLARAALAAGDGVDAGLMASYALRRLGRDAEVEQVLGETERLASTAEERARVAYERAYFQCWTRGEPAAAKDVLGAELARLGDHPARYRLMVLRADVSNLGGSLQEPLSPLAELVDDPAVPGDVRVQAIAQYAINLTSRGETVRAAKVLEDGIPSLLAVTASRPEVAAVLLTARHQMLVQAGRLDELDQFAEQCIGLAAGGGAWDFVSLIAFVRGYGLMLQGRLADGRRWLAEAVVGLGKHDVYGYRRVAVAGLVACCAQQGDLDAARAAAADLAARRKPFPFEANFVAHADGWLAAVSGDTEAAASRLLDGAANARRSHHAPLEAILLLEAARVGQAGAVVARLDELATGGCDSRWTQPASLFVRGIAGDDGTLLDEASEAFEAVPMRLVAAEASVLASLAHARVGMVARSRAAASRAQRLAADCQGAMTPILRQASEPPELTRRERDVARLAVRGLSDREIADELRVSVRTVESHLHNAYTKLGAGGRDELRDLLAPG